MHSTEHPTGSVGWSSPAPWLSNLTSCLIQKYRGTKELWLLFSLLQSLGNLIKAEQEVWTLTVHFPRSCKGCAIPRGADLVTEQELTGQDRVTVFSLFREILWEDMLIAA